MTAEWFIAHHLDTALGGLLFMAAICVRMQAGRSVRLWFAGAMATVAIICSAAIHFLP
jgi:hypothetical protein